MTTSPKSPHARRTPSWVVLLIFVVVPLVLAFVISRQAGAQQIRRKAIAKSYNWAVENRNEGRVAWILRGFHRDRPFEAVSLLREGGGAAFRVRVPVSRVFADWTLVVPADLDLEPRDFGTISGLLTRDAFPPKMPPPPGLEALRCYGPPDGGPLGLQAVVRRLPSQLRVAVSFVDDGVLLDGLGALPEGQALLPLLDLLVELAELVDPADGGR